MLDKSKEDIIKEKRELLIEEIKSILIENQNIIYINTYILEKIINCNNIYILEKKITYFFYINEVEIEIIYNLFDYFNNKFLNRNIKSEYYNYNNTSLLELFYFKTLLKNNFKPKQLTLLQRIWKTLTLKFN
jgi:hypothetical protein